MDYYIVYDVETGAVLWRGGGSIGDVPPGAEVLVVPQKVVAQQELDLAALRIHLCNGIDAEAEALRLQFLSPGAGQAMEYVYVASEALGWSADDSFPTPFLTAEAAHRGVEVSVIVAEVVAARDAWVKVGAQIRALRLAAKAAIEQAKTLGEIIAASQVDWASLG